MKITTQGVISIITGVSCLTIFTILLIHQKIGEPSYIILLSILSLFCIVVNVLPRVNILDFKNLKLSLRQIEEVKKEIFAKEQDLSKISYLFLKNNALNAIFSNIIGASREQISIRTNWNSLMTKQMIAALNISKNEKKELSEYAELLIGIDEANSNEDRMIEISKVYQIMKDEVEKSQI